MEDSIQGRLRYILGCSLTQFNRFVCPAQTYLIMSWKAFSLLLLFTIIIIIIIIIIRIVVVVVIVIIIIIVIIVVVIIIVITILSLTSGRHIVAQVWTKRSASLCTGECARTWQS